jgi:hypothetical protein
LPFGDGTGPLGRGAGTERRAGFCSGSAVPGSSHRGGGFCGRGRGWRNRQGAFGRPFGSASRDEEIGTLKAKAGFFERALETIRKRIEGLEAKAKPG